MSSSILSDIAKECADTPQARVKTINEAQRVAALLAANPDVEADKNVVGSCTFRYGPSVASWQACYYCADPVEINKQTIKSTIHKLTFLPAYHVVVCENCSSILAN